MDHLPMLEKRVDARVGVWCVFGEYPGLSVDISNGTDDVFTGLPPEVAVKVVEAHDRFREELYTILCRERHQEVAVQSQQ